MSQFDPSLPVASQKSQFESMGRRQRIEAVPDYRTLTRIQDNEVVVHAIFGTLRNARLRRRSLNIFAGRLAISLASHLVGRTDLFLLLVQIFARPGCSLLVGRRLGYAANNLLRRTLTPVTVVTDSG